MMLLRRYSQVGGKTHHAAWADLGHYHGPHHEDLREQSLAEFVTDHPEQCEDLSEEDVEAIRRGCILLSDAHEGRASHGLHSLLDEPRWKRVLFRIQTSNEWQNVVLGGSFLHAFLIAYEAPNWRTAHVDPAFDAPSLLCAELLIICGYIADVAMKMLYFGGWSDYVSKQWQRRYLGFIFLFSLDLVLFRAGLTTLRFSRPIRLFVVAGRHRDVRRLVSTIPKMCTSLVTDFAIPLFSALGFFAIIGHRFYGSLPSDADLNLGQETFRDVPSFVQSLFVMATLSNFDPVIVNTYQLHPWSFVPWLAFIIICSFFLMAVALGVVYDIYIEDHASTVNDEKKKLTKSLDKCFKKLDLNKSGVLEWKIFAEMMLHLRPQDPDPDHSFLIFREIARKGNGTSTPKDLVGVDVKTFGFLQDWVSVSFKKVYLECQVELVWWAKFEFRAVFLDAVLTLLQIDNVELYSGIQVGDIQVWLLAAIHVWLFIKFRDHFLQEMKEPWRIVDFLLLYLGLVSQLVTSACTIPRTSQPTVCTVTQQTRCLQLSAPFFQTLNAVSALRIFRAALHHDVSRKYLSAVGQITPVLLHFGSLVLCFVYFSAVVSMEVLAEEPVFMKVQTGYRNFESHHVMQCRTNLPSFGCIGDALVSTFMLFTGVNWHDVAYIHKPKENGYSETWNKSVILWFFTCYLVLGVILCNLLTTLIVEFHKVVSEEREPVNKVCTIETPSGEYRQTTAKERLRWAANAVKMAKRFDLKVENDSSQEDQNIKKTQVIMVGTKRNWRLRLSQSQHFDPADILQATKEA